VVVVTGMVLNATPFTMTPVPLPARLIFLDYGGAGSLTLSCVETDRPIRSGRDRRQVRPSIPTVGRPLGQKTVSPSIATLVHVVGGGVMSLY